MPTAQEVACKLKSPRTLCLERRQAYEESKQYEGFASWFDPEDIPLDERKPCIIYPIKRIAINSHVSFCLGEGRFPMLSSAPIEDDKDLDDEWGLSEDESGLFDRFLNTVLVEYCGMKSALQQVMAKGLSVSSAAIVISIRMGQVCLDALDAQYCTPTLDPVGNVTELYYECVKVEDRWPLVEGKPDQMVMVYRRLITATNDIWFKPAEVNQEKVPPTLPEREVDEARTMAHNFPMCPVIWYPCKKAPSQNDPDGCPIIKDEETENMDCLNRALSQRHRGATVASDPQKMMFGVGDDEQVGPAATGSWPSVNPQAIRHHPKETFRLSPKGLQGGGSARVKSGPGVVWRTRNEKARFEQMTLPGDALRGTTEHCDDIKSKTAEILSHVLVDPDHIKTHAVLSGKAMSLIYAKQIAFDDLLREDFGLKCINPLISMLLRILQTLPPERVRLPGLKKVQPILKKFVAKVENTDEIAWIMPRLGLQWGPYFDDDSQAQLFTVQMVVAAVEGGVIPLQIGVEKLLSTGVFTADSATELVKQIQVEQDEKHQKEVELAKASPNVPGAPGKPGGAKAGGNSNGRSQPSSRP